LYCNVFAEPNAKTLNFFHHLFSLGDAMTFLFSSLLLALSGCRSEESLKAYNSEPQATITSHSEGAEIQEGYTITLVGQVSDANHLNPDLLVTWSTGNGDLCTDIVPTETGETSC